MNKHPEPFREWDRTQWAYGSPQAEPEEAAGTPRHRRWNKWQWVGERADHSRVEGESAEAMQEGEGGPSGFRHNPGEQHWADAEPGRGTAEPARGQGGTG